MPVYIAVLLVYSSLSRFLFLKWSEGTEGQRSQKCAVFLVSSCPASARFIIQIIKLYLTLHSDYKTGPHTFHFQETHMLPCCTLLNLQNVLLNTYTIPHSMFWHTVPYCLCFHSCIPHSVCRYAWINNQTAPFIVWNECVSHQRRGWGLSSINWEASSIPTFSISALLSLSERISKFIK